MISKISKYLILCFVISSCCTEVYFKPNEIFWFENYQAGEELTFISNNGDIDTVKITNIHIKKPTGDCSPLVSNYDNEFVRVDYQIKKDTFEIINGWLIQHSAEPGSEIALPVLRFLNMEYNQQEGDLKEEIIDFGNREKVKVFVFDKTNCGMNYNQKFGLVNFKWGINEGLISYQNSTGETWLLKK